jgi:hypothetical protein
MGHPEAPFLGVRLPIPLPLPINNIASEPLLLYTFSIPEFS